MSTVAFDGNTIAADKQSTSADLALITTKLKRLSSGIILATVGGTAEGRIMMKWFEDGADLKSYPECQKDKENWARLIVILADGAVYEYESQPIALHFQGGPRAWGSGRDYALGAMENGTTAERAIITASKYDIYTGCGVDAITL